MSTCCGLQTAVLHLITYYLLSRVCGDVMPTTLRLVEGDSLYLSWQAELGPLSSCSVLTPRGETITLGNSGRVVYWGEGMATGVCGLRADNMAQAVDNGTWLLMATGHTTGHRSTNVTVYQATIDGTKRNLTGKIDEYLMIQCGPEKEVLHCELISPDNETRVIRLGKCQLEIFTLEYRHEGLWTCRYLLLYQSFQARATTAVNIITNTVNFVVGQNETETELNIFCSHPEKPIQNMAYCSILPPNGAERMSLAPGQGLSRYRYYGFAPFHCGVAISKPLQTAEYGPWLCEMVYTSRQHKGGYVFVKNNRIKRSVSIQPLQSTASVKVVLSDKKPLVVTCAVPSSLVYCWLQHPNGTVYSPIPDQFYNSYKYYGEGYDFGQCGINVNTPSVSDSGAWTCGMGLKSDYDVDNHEVTTVINVVVSDLPLVPYKTTFLAKKNDVITVGCGMVHQQAVSYCRFWKPDKTGLTIDIDSNTSASPLGKYLYAGTGLYVGDCSLLVSGLQDDDFGSWICGTTPMNINHGGELTTKFEVVEQRSGVSLAAGFGILVGVVVIALGVTVVFIHNKKKLRNSNETLGPTGTSVSTGRLVEVESEAGSISSRGSAPIVKISKRRVLFQRRNQLS